MADTRKRKPIMDAIFGAPLKGDELARQIAARPPAWFRRTAIAAQVIIVVALVTSLLGRGHLVPVIGPWLGQTGWGQSALTGLSLVIIAVWEWYTRALQASRP